MNNTCVVHACEREGIDGEFRSPNPPYRRFNGSNSMRKTISPSSNIFSAAHILPKERKFVNGCGTLYYQHAWCFLFTNEERKL